MSYFSELDLARRYEATRPYFHPQLIERLKALLRTDSRFERALDVGCGTGQSTRALLASAATVIGIDASEAMLRCASRQPNIHYVLGTAEELPFPGNQFDFITVSSAFHWFDRLAFLQQAHGVLRGYWMVVYNDGFFGLMKENDAFKEWQKQYLFKYPTPPRNSAPLGDAELSRVGFRQMTTDQFRHFETYTFEQLCTYLTTQTNITAAVKEGRATEASVSAWFLQTLQPLFQGPAGTFEFGCSYTLFQKRRQTA